MLNQAYAMIVQDESQQNVGANIVTGRGDPFLAMQATGRGQGFRGKKQSLQCEH